MMGQTVSTLFSQNSCLLLKTTGSTASPADLPTVIQDLKTQSHGLIGQADELVSSLTERFPDCFTADTLSWLNQYHFLDQLGPNNTEEDISNDDIATTLLAQWVRWSKLLKLLDYIRTHDEIHEAADYDGSAVSEIRRQLDIIQARSYNLACQLKIALNTLGRDTHTPEYEPSAEFRSLGERLEMELQRAYVVTREVKATSEHDYAYYESIVGRRRTVKSSM